MKKAIIILFIIVFQTVESRAQQSDNNNSKEISEQKSNCWIVKSEFESDFEYSTRIAQQGVSSITKEIVKQKFNEWLKKSEFESNNEYTIHIDKESLPKIKELTTAVLDSMKMEFLHFYDRSGSRTRIGYIYNRDGILEWISYDAENQTCFLRTKNQIIHTSDHNIIDRPYIDPMAPIDSFYIVMPRNVASILNKKGANLLLKYDDVQLINDRWTINNAIILFSQSIDETKSRGNISNYYKYKESHGRIEVYDFKNTNTKFFDLKKLKTIPISLPNEYNYYYYKYSIFETPNYNPIETKQISFKISDLKIVLPNTEQNIQPKFKETISDISQPKKFIVDKAEIDLNIPQSKMENKDAIAVIIGNSNYANTKSVAYAISDAQSMKNYLMSVLGFKEGNILFKENATLGDFNTLFGTKENQKGRLANTIKENISDVFIFYAGHGAPGLKDNKGYFVPVECNPNYVENSGYSLDVFYQNLAQLKAKSLTIVLDACFSGANVFDKISPLTIKVIDPVLTMKNAVVIASSSGTEVSTWYDEKQHGMFTYFFLKAIQDKEHSDKNKDGSLTYQELYDYVADRNEGVPYQAARIHGIEQHPTITGDMKEKVFIKY